MRTIAAILGIAFLAGCASLGKVGDGKLEPVTKATAKAALTAASVAAPEYAGTIKQLQRLLDPPSKTAADDGMTPFEEWFFKGNKIDKNDLSIHCGNEKYIKPTARDLNPTKAATASTDENIVIARDDLKAILEAGDRREPAVSLPTVKLTFDEWFALATRAGSLLDPDKIRAAFIAAFGEKRGLGYFNTHDGESWSQRDTWLFVRALAPAIPGDTEDAQIDWIMEHAAPCFATTARFAEVTAFVRDRVDAFKDAGGSLDTYTDADVSPAAKKDIDLAGAIWGGGINGSKAIITQQITSLTFTGSKFFIQTSAGTRTWTTTTDGCNQYACLAVCRNGEWFASKFDWQRPSNTERDLNNVYGNYMGWIPRSGEVVYYFQINLPCTERTNAVAITWP